MGKANSRDFWLILVKIAWFLAGFGRFWQIRDLLYIVAPTFLVFAPRRRRGRAQRYTALQYIRVALSYFAAKTYKFPAKMS